MADEIAAGLMAEIWVTVPQMAFQVVDTDCVAVEGADQ
jgi:hypothetical protein